MQFVTQILIHTPLWVWPLFAYLVWLGIQAMRPRTTTIWRSLIVPAIFIIWGLSGLVSQSQNTVLPLVAWLAAALVLGATGFLLAKPFELDHTTGEIKRPGSIVPLIRNLTIFALQYTVRVIMAIDPEARLTATVVGRAVGGAMTGYFLGRTVALLRQYYKQRQADLKISPHPP
jgi:uncharacterized protein DUF6622